MTDKVAAEGLVSSPPMMACYRCGTVHPIVGPCASPTSQPAPADVWLKVIHAIAVEAMTAQSDPNAEAQHYRKALIGICNMALKAQDVLAEVSSPASQMCVCGHAGDRHHPDTEEDGTSCWVQFCECAEFRAEVSSPASKKDIHPSIVWLIEQVESKATGLDVEWGAVKALLSTYNARPELWRAEVSSPASQNEETHGHQPVGSRVDRGRTVVSGKATGGDEGAIHVYSHDAPTYLCADCTQQWQASHSSYLVASSAAEVSSPARPRRMNPAECQALADATGLQLTAIDGTIYKPLAASPARQEREFVTSLPTCQHARQHPHEDGSQFRCLDCGAVLSLTVLASSPAASLMTEIAVTPDTTAADVMAHPPRFPDLAASPARPQLEQEVESLRAQFAAFADQIQNIEVKASLGSDWGHMRYAILAMLSVLQSTARKMANGQPAYIPTYKLRAEKAEAEVARLLADGAVSTAPLGVEQFLVALQNIPIVTKFCPDDAHESHNCMSHSAVDRAAVLLVANELARSFKSL